MHSINFSSDYSNYSEPLQKTEPVWISLSLISGKCQCDFKLRSLLKLVSRQKGSAELMLEYLMRSCFLREARALQIEIE